MNNMRLIAPACFVFGIGLAAALMKTRTKEKNGIYLILQTAVCVLLAGLLCAQAMGIYLEGTARKAASPLEPVFTPEIVAEKLMLLAPLFLFAAGLTIGGILTGAKVKNPRKPMRTACIQHEPKTPKQPGAARTALLILATFFILIGVLNGSALDVLTKAINICSECVGLG